MAIENSPARNRSDHHGEAPDGHLHLHLVEEKAMQGLLDNPAAGDEEQQGFEQRGEVFHLAVPVEMRAVGRLAGDSHGNVRHQRGHQVEPRVRRLGQDAEAARQQAHDGFHGGEPDRGHQRTERGRSLLAVFSRQLRRHYSESSTPAKPGTATLFPAHFAGIRVTVPGFAPWDTLPLRRLIPCAPSGTTSATPDTPPQPPPWRWRNRPGSDGYSPAPLAIAMVVVAAAYLVWRKWFRK